jgi:superfamily I DNA/RNA helicase
MSRGLTLLTLTKTRRCPKSHVEIAQAFVPAFEAMASAPQGEVNTMPLAAAIDLIAPGDMVQCRNNAPLATLVWKLLRRHLKVQIAGRNDFGEGLINLIDRMKTDDIPTLIERIETYRGRELTKLEKRKNAGRAAETLNDKCDTLIALTEGTDTAKALKELISSIFAEVNDAGDVKHAVLLTTTHKAKGLEAETVWVLDPSLYPSSYAKLPHELQQERNLEYVRDTRSMRVLNYITVEKTAAPGRSTATAEVARDEEWEESDE